MFFIGWHIGSTLEESNTNYSDKIAIIGSIIIFHSIPFLYYKKFFLNNLYQKKLLILISFAISGILIFYFNYNLNSAGGGIFLHISNFLIGNNYLFYLLLPFFIFFILNILKIKLSNNLIVVLVLLLVTPQYHIFHKYYDPLVFILCLTMIDFELQKDFFSKKKYIFSAYLLFFTHYLISFIHSYYIKF